jgi:maleylpyruvate isomerase
MIPQLDLAGARRAHDTLCEYLDGLTDDEARQASLLPDWTVGHVLTHIARNADSITRMFEAANGGEIGDQYPGGAAQRTADIEAGANRTAAELVADVRDSCGRLDRAWSATTDAAWALGSGRMMAGELPLSDMVFRRWREVEVHHADLGLGVDHSSWTAAFVDVALPRTLAELPARLSLDDRRVLLAWLMGRSATPPALPTW